MVTKGRFLGKMFGRNDFSLLSLHKIGCGSAIKVNFIALALHYLCNRNNTKQ